MLKCAGYRINPNQTYDIILQDRFHNPLESICWAKGINQIEAFKKLEKLIEQGYNYISDIEIRG